MLLIIVLEAFVFKKLWGWFLVPKIGAPQIGIAQAAGISLFLNHSIVMPISSSITNYSCQAANTDPVPIIIALALSSVMIPAVTLLTGWTIKQFMD